MFLDFAENQAQRRQAMSMQQWADRLDAFLEFNEHQVLQDSGKISQKVAKQLAEQEYDKFAEQRRDEQEREPSDFDAFIAKTKTLETKKTDPKKWSPRTN